MAWKEYSKKLKRHYINDGLYGKVNNYKWAMEVSQSLNRKGRRSKIVVDDHTVQVFIWEDKK